MDNVVTGHTYTFSACNGTGAGSWPISYTIIAPSGAIDAFGTDAGSTCALTWTATEDGTYEIGISEAGIACNSSTNTTTNNGHPAITCSGASTCVACTETAPPACTTAIAPVDAETDTVTATAADGSREVAFSWNAITGADSYDVSLDGNVLGNTPNTSVNIYALDYSTSYTWSIAPVNCFGAATGCPTWTFTTEADPALSVDAFESNSITHFYNTNSNSLVLKSSNLVFTNLEIFDILGKQVLTKKLNSKEESINLNTINTGIYIAKISTNNGVETIKFVKK